MGKILNTVLLTLTLAACGPQEITPISDIVKRPENFSNKVVTIVGFLLCRGTVDLPVETTIHWGGGISTKSTTMVPHINTRIYERPSTDARGINLKPLNRKSPVVCDGRQFADGQFIARGTPVAEANGEIVLTGADFRAYE